MTPRGFIALALATGIALVAAIALVIVEQVNVGGNRGGGGLMFPELAERMAEIDTLTIVGPQYAISVKREADGQWVAVDRGNYPVNGAPVDQLVAGLAELVEYEQKTDTPELYADLGVEGPGEGRDDVQVTITADDGDVLVDAVLGYAAQSIGRHTRGGMFVRRVDEDRVWLAEGAARPPAFEADFFGQLFNIPGPTVGRVQILAGDTLLFDAIKVDFDTGDYELEYLDPSIGPANAVAADSAVRNMSQAIVSVSFRNVRAVEDVTVAPDARTVRYVTQDGLSLSVTLADADGVTYVIFAADAAPGSAAEAQAAEIAAATDGFAFELPPGRYITLERSVSELFTIPAEPAPEPEGPAPVVPLLPLP